MFLSFFVSRLFSVTPGQSSRSCTQAGGGALDGLPPKKPTRAIALPSSRNSSLLSRRFHEGGQGGRNTKREAKDKKYGFGGKKREKGQSDPRSLNDLSAYNPKHGGSGRSRSVSFVLVLGFFLPCVVFSTVLSFCPSRKARV